MNYTFIASLPDARLRFMFIDQVKSLSQTIIP